LRQPSPISATDFEPLLSALDGQCKASDRAHQNGFPAPAWAYTIAEPITSADTMSSKILTFMNSFLV
jgi:hypothetical protein